MTNPARILADLFESWSVPQSRKPEMVRGADAQANDLEFWHGQSEAVFYLRELERILNALSTSGHDVSYAEKLLPKFYKAVFAFTTPWTVSSQNAQRPVIDDGSIGTLRAVATTIDVTRLSPALPDDQFDKISDAIEHAAELVRHADELPEPLRLYLLTLIDEIRAALQKQEWKQHTPRIRHLCFELTGALSTASAYAPEGSERRKKLADAARQVAIGALAAVLGNLPFHLSGPSEIEYTEHYDSPPSLAPGSGSPSTLVISDSSDSGSTTP